MPYLRLKVFEQRRLNIAKRYVLLTFRVYVYQRMIITTYLVWEAHIPKKKLDRLHLMYLKNKVSM